MQPTTSGGHITTSTPAQNPTCRGPLRPPGLHPLIDASTSAATGQLRNRTSRHDMWPSQGAAGAGQGRWASARLASFQRDTACRRRKAVAGAAAPNEAMQVPDPMPSALVTGASRGIGAAIAKRLARDGFDVAIHYHQDKAGAEATREAVEETGSAAVAMQADLADPLAAWQLAHDAVAALQDLAVLVNNAGTYLREGLEQVSGDSWRRTMAVNLDAPAAICQALAPNLQRQHGSIIHVSSIVAVRGSSHGVHYAASKAGMLGLMRAQALELAPVRVNAVCPGYIDTDLLAGDSPERRAQREAEVPMGRVGRPEDVAGAVSWLAGPDAAYVTGQAIHVNGGLWMG